MPGDRPHRGAGRKDQKPLPPMGGDPGFRRLRRVPVDRPLHPALHGQRQSQATGPQLRVSKLGEVCDERLQGLRRPRHHHRSQNHRSNHRRTRHQSGRAQEGEGGVQREDGRRHRRIQVGGTAAAEGLLPTHRPSLARVRDNGPRLRVVPHQTGTSKRV